MNGPVRLVVGALAMLAALTVIVVAISEGWIGMVPVG